MRFIGAWAGLAFIALLISCASHPPPPAPPPIPGIVGPIDYTDAGYVEDWLHHPVLGDPSWDAFNHLPGNPIHRGAPPFEWPVNGFFFRDPVGGGWYVYIGEYPKGYFGGPARCVLVRSMDKGHTWEHLGTVLPEDPAAFDGDGNHAGSMPDVSVVYDDASKRYHMIYDWVKPDLSDGGIAYAWAEKPEGPFRRDAAPILRKTTQEPLAGKYRRPYAATLLKREKDWLILGSMDAPPYGWAMVAMTADDPSGPWSKPVLVRHAEADYFHPPLVEFFPAFVHQGTVYAPATSVAMNRDFQAVFEAPLEQAHDPSAWSPSRAGSVWHSEDLENEAKGIWGQTFSGWVDSDGTLHAMFPGRDPNGMGTINLAERSWNMAMRPKGFYLTGQEGQSMTLLRQGYAQYKLGILLRLNGRARLLWDYTAPLGPDKPASGATIHPASLTRYTGLEMSGQSWSVVRVDSAGQLATLASGPRPTSTKLDSKGKPPPIGPDWEVEVRHRGGGESVWISGIKVWAEGAIEPAGIPELPAGDETQPVTAAATQAADADSPTVPVESRRSAGTDTGPAITRSGAVGLLVGADSHALVTRFRLRGVPQAQELSFLYTEALMDSADEPGNWFELRNDDFRFGLGAVSKAEGASAKWCVPGRRLTIYSPKGPDYGTVEVKVDGDPAGTIDLHADRQQKSAPVWTAGVVAGYHAIVIKATSGLLPLDSVGATE